MFVKTPDRYINLNHVATAVIIESRGQRAVKLCDGGGRELAVVREADFLEALQSEYSR